MNIILASGSPRRKEILERLGVDFRIVTSDREEIVKYKDPQMVVRDLSCTKATDVFQKVLNDEKEDFVVIAADTVVAAGGEILGKPADKADAIRMIGMLSNGVHQVFTGVTIIIRNGEKTKTVSFEECTDVNVIPLTAEEIEKYVDSGEPMDKAGAYAIQGRFAPYIEEISGDYYNIVGLPISRVVRELKKNNITIA